MDLPLLSLPQLQCQHPQSQGSHRLLWQTVNSRIWFDLEVLVARGSGQRGWRQVAGAEGIGWVEMFRGGGRVGAPEWRSGLRHCILVQEVSQQSLNPGCITTGCDWESHRPAHNWPSVVWIWPVKAINVNKNLLLTSYGWGQY